MRRKWEKEQEHAYDVEEEDAEMGDAEEDEDETPAQKRLRLAKLYLDSVKQGLSLGAFHMFPSTECLC